MWSVARCREEIAAVELQIRAGHPDLEGLCRALADWSAELRLLRGLAAGAHPLGHVRAEAAGSTPLFAQARRLRYETGSNVSPYRKKNWAGHNTFAGPTGIATRVPRLAHVRAERGACRYWPSQRLAQLDSLDQTDHEKQHHGSDGRRDQASDQSTGADAKGAKEPAAYESANNAEDKISNQAVAAASHQLSSKPARHQADEKKPQEIHIPLPPCELRGRSCVTQPVRTIMAQMDGGRNGVKQEPTWGKRPCDWPTLVQKQKRPAIGSAGRAWKDGNA